MLKKLQVLKKHLLDAGKVPDAGKYLFKAGKTPSLILLLLRCQLHVQHPLSEVGASMIDSDIRLSNSFPQGPSNSHRRHLGHSNHLDH